MNIALPPMGWNSWNTFGENISDQLILDTARAMKEKGYLDKGYEYVVIDDIWSLHQRDENGRLVADPAKFPRGMKALADDIHALGFKFGMYSCAGRLTCAGYPSSFDYEFIDAQTFADWGVDFLKYDFCNFPEGANGRQRYAAMSMALKATGRDILFSACNWGTDAPWGWMKSVGAHMYRSTGDIHDNFKSFTDIAKSQLDNFCMSGANCFNDMDMLTIGMYGNGNVALGEACTAKEYQTQFALWCLMGSPLMMGGDVRNMDEDCERLLLNDGLLRISQDIECRPAQVLYRGSGDADGLTLFRFLSDDEFAIGYFNFAPEKAVLPCRFADAGLLGNSGFGLRLRDAITGEALGVRQDSLDLAVESHGCRVLLGRLEKI